MSAPLILYIEDNISNLELVKRILEIEGFEIMKAAGCDGYIPKPIDIDKLPKQILDFLGRGL